MTNGIDNASTVEATDLAQVTLAGVATQATATKLHRRLAGWLKEHSITETRMSPILAGVKEALANCVDHAYPNQVGGMKVQADYDPTAGSISLCITDHGKWRRPVQHTRRNLRVRGISLMQALADHCTINGRNDGTTVCLDYRTD